MKRNVILLRFLGLIAVLSMSLSFAPAQAAQNESKSQVLVVRAVGPVFPPFADYIERGLAEAQARHAEAVMLVMDTPGGSVDIMLNLVQSIRNSPVPVVVFITPRGAKAASAGLLITLAGHAAAMSPDTAIGAASPVGASGEDLDQTMQQKAKELLSAEARSLAERRGPKAVELASDGVNSAKAVSATEALDAKLIDFIADNPPELLQKLDGFKVEVNGSKVTLNTAHAELVELPMTPVEQALLALSEVVSNPNIAFLLLVGGIILLIAEFATPGGWIAGTLGVIMLGLALYGIGLLPVNWLGMVFIVLAFALFFADVKAPTHGLLTMAGAASLIAGAIILFSAPEVAAFGQLSIPLVVVVTILAAGMFFGLVMFAVRIQKRTPVTGREGLIGRAGKVVRDLTPDGTVAVWGETWQAISADGAAIASGRDVEVVAVEGMRVRVKPKAGS